jgi:hypothetical protein
MSKSIFSVIEKEISPVPTYLKSVLTACALDNFIAISDIQDSDIKDIESCCCDRFDELNLKDTDFLTYYKSKDLFVALKSGHIKLLKGISNAINNKGHEAFNKMFQNDSDIIAIPTAARSSNSSSKSKSDRLVETEKSKLITLITNVLKNKCYSTLAPNTDYDLKVTVSHSQGQTFSAQVQCPFNLCTKNIRIYLETRVLKKGKATRWVLSNFKTHYSKHLKQPMKTNTKNKSRLRALFIQQNPIENNEVMEFSDDDNNSSLKEHEPDSLADSHEDNNEQANLQDDFENELDGESGSNTAFDDLIEEEYENVEFIDQPSGEGNGELQEQ